jgi:hypothetical protein
MSARRAAWSNVLRVRGRAFVRQVFIERGASREVVRCPWFRAQDSNLCFWIQRPVSFQLDDPGVRRGERPRSQDAAVGPEGLEPSPPRLRVECACRLRYGPETTRAGSRPAREGGTRGSRTLIPRGKSPVLAPIELASPDRSKRYGFDLVESDQIPSLRSMIDPQDKDVLFDASGWMRRRYR